MSHITEIAIIRISIYKCYYITRHNRLNLHIWHIRQTSEYSLTSHYIVWGLLYCKLVEGWWCLTQAQQVHSRLFAFLGTDFTLWLLRKTKTKTYVNITMCSQFYILHILQDLTCLACKFRYRKPIVIFI